MKVSIIGYEVEIKAKGVYGTKYNNVDAKEFLLELAHVLSLAQNTALNVGLSDTHDSIVKSMTTYIMSCLRTAWIITDYKATAET